MIPTLVGYQTDPTAPPEGIYAYTLHGNGLALRASRPELRATLPLAVCSVRGRAPLTPGIQLLIPRLPAIYLQEVLRQARQARDAQGQQIEQLWYLGWNARSSTWWLDSPPQAATPVSVISTAGARYPPHQHAVLEIHSHHHLMAYWSPTDDRDELGFRIYGVLGVINTNPCIRFRIGLHGYVWEIPPMWICELPAEFTTHPADRLEPVARDLTADFS